MKQTPKWNDEIHSDDVTFTHTEIMAKFIATIDPDGYPHLTFITSTKAISPKIVKWGAFTYGNSKRNVKKNPKQGILCMSAAMPFQFLQIKADFDYLSMDGSDAADFNQMSMFRYNTYMRIDRIFFNTVYRARRIRDISLLGIVGGILANLNPFRNRGKTGVPENRLESVGNRLFQGMVFPKFISYIDSDGYPIIIPCFQARSVERKRIVFPLSQFKQDLLQIPEGAKVSVFAMDFETVNQMVQGKYLGIDHKLGIIDIERVYNSMPPKIGELYPNKAKKQKISEFPQLI